MRPIDRQRLPAATGGLLAVCCTLHLILLAAGVGVLAAAAAGASLAALAVAAAGAGLWWTTRRHAATRHDHHVPRGATIDTPQSDSPPHSVRPVPGREGAHHA
jgi:hypothetical protein